MSENHLDRAENAPGEALLPLLRCVRCRARARLLLDDEGLFRCEDCGAGYACVDGLPELLGEEQVLRRRPLAQGLMDSRLVAAVYEGVLWRRSHTS